MTQESKVQRLTCEDSCRVVGAPAAVEPVEVPVPLVTEPVEVTDAEAAIRVAIDRAPEEHDLAFPSIRDELGMLKQVVEQVSVE